MIIIKITDVPMELYSRRIGWGFGEIMQHVGESIRDAVNDKDSTSGYVHDRNDTCIGTWAIEED